MWHEVALRPTRAVRKVHPQWHEVALRSAAPTREGRKVHPHMEAAQWASERFPRGEWSICGYAIFTFRDSAAAFEFKLRWG